MIRRRGPRGIPEPSAARAFFLLIPLLLAGCERSEPDLEEVLARHAEALGGAERLAEVESVRVELRVEEDFVADLVYRAMRPDKARVDVSIDGEVVYVEAYDGERAWQQGGPEAPVAEVNAEGTAALRRGAVGNLYALYELPGLGHRLELLERTGIDGVRYPTVKVTWDDGHVDFKYLDPETFLVARERDVHALHPDLDPTKRLIEGRKLDYRDVGGVLRPFRQSEHDVRTGELLQTTEIREIALNPPLDPAIFQPPALAPAQDPA